MIDDKLSAEQRIRLEAVAQANQQLGPCGIEMPDRAINTLLAQAARIADWISDGTTPARQS